MQATQIAPALAATESPVRELNQRFEAQVRANPDRIAVTFQDDHFTYRELDIWSADIAGRLSRHCGPDDIVAIVVERGVAALAGILAVIRLGRAYLPLDPALPPTRLQHLLREAQPACLLLISNDSQPSSRGERPAP